jgi:hypothetical protein
LSEILVIHLLVALVLLLLALVLEIVYWRPRR